MKIQVLPAPSTKKGDCYMGKIINLTCSGYCPYNDDEIIFDATFTSYEVLGATSCYYRPRTSSCSFTDCPYHIDKCPILEEVVRTL